MQKKGMTELISNFINLNKQNMNKETEDFLDDFEEFVEIRLDMVCNKLEKMQKYKKLQDKYNKAHDYFSTRIPETEVNEFERNINKTHELEKVYIYLQGLIDGRTTV